MNERARKARRILRDHRRAPNLYSHTRYLGPLNVNWACPRCAGRIFAPSAGVMNVPIWYDRKGKPLTMHEVEPLLSDESYKRIALTRVFSASDPGVKRNVSTVWLAVNYQFGDGPPIIFETMVFSDDAPPELCNRYATEEQARAGHAEIVTLVAATVRDEIVVDEERQAADPEPSRGFCVSCPRAENINGPCPCDGEE